MSTDFSALFGATSAVKATKKETGLDIAGKTSEVYAMADITFLPEFNYRWSKDNKNPKAAEQQLQAQCFELSPKSGKLVPYGDFKVIVDSIKETAGSTVPVEIADIPGIGDNVVISGFRRHLAHTHLGYDHIVATHLGKMDRMSALARSMMENSTDLKAKVNWVFKFQAEAEILQAAGWDGVGNPSAEVKKLARTMGLRQTNTKGDVDRNIYRNHKSFARIPDYIKDLASATDSKFTFESAVGFCRSDDGNTIQFWEEDMLKGWCEELFKLRNSRKVSGRSVTTEQVEEALENYRAIVKAKDSAGEKLSKGESEAEGMQKEDRHGAANKKANAAQATKERKLSTEQLAEATELLVAVLEGDAPKGSPDKHTLEGIVMGLAMGAGKTTSFGMADCIIYGKSFTAAQVFQHIAERDLPEGFMDTRFATKSEKNEETGKIKVTQRRPGKALLADVYQRFFPTMIQGPKEERGKVNLTYEESWASLEIAKAKAVEFVETVCDNAETLKQIEAHNAAKSKKE